ncbi:MAG TPA: molybdopterin-dependent oxidoreductase [Syntrophomonas sp.]|nr:molybdopterin-dependent oxidoreductase [Syntrophomonas sp.]
MSKKPQEVIPKDVNLDVYHKEWRWQEGDGVTVTRTCQWTAPGCHDGCSVLFYEKDGKIVDIEGDPNSPYNQGRLCMRCLNMVEAVNHPDRLKYPMKRAGERGENKWERISWDEALDIIEKNVRDIWRDYGPESIVGMQGTGRNIIWHTPYLTYSAFKSPNFALGFLSGDACYLPRTATTMVCMGDFFVADCSQNLELRYDDPSWTKPEVVMVWGNNPLISNGDGFFGHWIVDLMKMGTKLIVVDPRLTWLAARAEYWLQLRPGTDAALALAFIDTIIKEDLYDHDFVENWTYGFEELAERAAQYPAEEVEAITWVDAELIKKAARFFAAAKPATIQWGLAVDTQLTGIPTAHALCCIGSMCGNVDIPGGMMQVRCAYNVADAYGCGKWNLPQEMIEKQIGFFKSPMHSNHFAASAHGDSVLETIESGKPYPIRMLFLQTTNPIANMAAEAPRVYAAMKKVPFIVNVDPFMTPTSVAFADLCLPAAFSCERNSVRAWWWPLKAITKVSEFYEAKSDEQIILEIGKRLNPELFPWKDDIEMMSWWIQTGEKFPVPWPKKAEFDFNELKEKVISWPQWEYEKYKKGLLRPDGEPGFNTPTGKVEYYSTLFDAWGNDPLPYHEEPPESPVSTPQMYKEYPLVLTTGARSWEYFHSEYRQMPTMRESHPDPIVEMHPDTAAKLGIIEGDWVWIENHRGKCKERVRLEPAIDPRVVHGEHGWWFPEKQGAEPVLFGTFESNINNLTQQGMNGPTGYGSPYKNNLCKVYKVTEANDQDINKLVVEGGFGYVKNYR